MTVHGFLSDVGHGKTLSAVMFAWEDYNAGIPIISNIPLTFPFDWFDPMILRDKNRWDELTGHTLLIDEIDSVADNRRSSSKDNILLSAISWFHRKAEVSILYTSHQLDVLNPDTIRSVDVRIDEYTNHWWLPTASRIHPLYIDEVPQYITLEWITRTARGIKYKVKDFIIPQESIYYVGSLYDTKSLTQNPLLDTIVNE